MELIISTALPSTECSSWPTYCIAGNFRGRKFSRISRFESHPWKFSPWNLGVCRTHLWLVLSNPWKYSSQNSHFLRIRESFLPRKFTTIQYSVSTLGLLYSFISFNMWILCRQLSSNRYHGSCDWSLGLGHHWRTGACIHIRKIFPPNTWNVTLFKAGQEERSKKGQYSSLKEIR